LKTYKTDSKIADDYYLKYFINKSQMQLFLEEMLIPSQEKYCIADVACGAGSLSHHLKQIYPKSDFYLFDLNEKAINLSKKMNPDANFHFFLQDMYSLEIADNFFDITFCWQTLSFVDHPQNAINELMRITKPGGIIIISSLFNIEHNVDIYTHAVDFEQKSSTKKGEYYFYNCFSLNTISKWVGKGKKMEFFKFAPKEVITCDSRGLGTYTVNLETGEKLQISGGILLNWYILKITK